MLAHKHLEKYGSVNIKSLTGHEDDVTCCAFSSDWLLLITGAHDFTLRLWDVSTGKALYTFNGHTCAVKCVCFNFQNDKAASGGHDNLVFVWDVKTGTCLHKLLGHTLSVESVSFSHSGDFLCSASWDNTAILWQLEYGRTLMTLQDHTSVVSCCCFSTTSNMLATGSWDYGIHVYNITECTEAVSESGSSRASSRLSVTPIPIKRKKKEADSKTLTGHTSNIKTVVFSSNDLLASASWDCTVRLWDPVEGVCLYILNGHEGFVHTCTFSLDGLYIASAADDDTIKIWSVKNGKLLKSLESFTDEIHHLAFTKEGTLLASGPEQVALCLY